MASVINWSPRHEAENRSSEPGRPRRSLDEYSCGNPLVPPPRPDQVVSRECMLPKLRARASPAAFATTRNKRLLSDPLTLILRQPAAGRRATTWCRAVPRAAPPRMCVAAAGQANGMLMPASIAYYQITVLRRDPSADRQSHRSGLPRTARRERHRHLRMVPRNSCSKEVLDVEFGSRRPFEGHARRCQTFAPSHPAALVVASPTEQRRKWSSGLLRSGNDPKAQAALYLSLAPPGRRAARSTTANVRRHGVAVSAAYIDLHQDPAPPAWKACGRRS